MASVTAFQQAPLSGSFFLFLFIALARRDGHVRIGFLLHVLFWVGKFWDTLSHLGAAFLFLVCLFYVFLFCSLFCMMVCSSLMLYIVGTYEREGVKMFMTC